MGIDRKHPSLAKRPLVYVASPFSHRYRRVRAARAKAALNALVWFMENDIPAFVPIAHSYQADKVYRASHEYWMAIDVPILTVAAGALVVLQMPEWDKSRGVNEEIVLAMGAGLKTFHIPCPIDCTGVLPQETRERLMEFAAIYHDGGVR